MSPPPAQMIFPANHTIAHELLSRDRRYQALDPTDQQIVRGYLIAHHDHAGIPRTMEWIAAAELDKVTVTGRVQANASIWAAIREGMHHVMVDAAGYGALAIVTAAQSLYQGLADGSRDVSTLTATERGLLLDAASLAGSLPKAKTGFSAFAATTGNGTQIVGASGESEDQVQAVLSNLARRVASTLDGQTSRSRAALSIRSQDDPIDVSVSSDEDQ